MISKLLQYRVDWLTRSSEVNREIVFIFYGAMDCGQDTYLQGTDF